MKAFLMYPGQDFDLDRDPPPGAADLFGDLELSTLLPPWPPVTSSCTRWRPNPP
jgi:hypothetical protein